MHEMFGGKKHQYHSSCGLYVPKSTLQATCSFPEILSWICCSKAGLLSYSQSVWGLGLSGRCCKGKIHGARFGLATATER